MDSTIPSKKRYTQADMEKQAAVSEARGWRMAEERMRVEREALAHQKAQLDIDQTKAVTDLLRAAGENLSKAGYLIGKLNKDNSR